MVFALAAITVAQYRLEGAGKRAAGGRSTLCTWQLLGERPLWPSGETGGGSAASSCPMPPGEGDFSGVLQR